MKGFIKILEAIIAAIILLSSISFFFTITKVTNWNDIILKTNVQDALAVLDKTGQLAQYIELGNDGIDQMNDVLTDMLPKSIDFSVEITGIPNPEIRVSCLCNIPDFNRLKNDLAPLTFPYKNRTIHIRIQNITIDGLDNIRNDGTNVLFIYDYNTYIDQVDKNKFNLFLQEDGTIFFLSDIDQTIVNDIFVGETFGLEWNDTLGNGGSRIFNDDISFFAPYRIATYYMNVTNNGTGDTHDFLAFNSGNMIRADNNTIIRSNTAYPTSYIKLNEFITSSGNGRTVWFAEYDRNAGIETDKINGLLKAVMLWASGEKFKMDPYPKHIGPLFRKIKYVSVANGVEPFAVDLIVWRIFF